MERYKARLVTKGFTKREGVDYHDTFAPVAKLVTLRTLLAFVVKRRWGIQQLDVKNAFIHGDLKEEVYMKITQGFSTKDETRVRWLLKELNVAVVGPTPLFCDNQAAKHIANNPAFHERTKQVEMDCYFVRERVERKEIMHVHINSKQQIADLLTKPLGSHLLQTLLVKLGIQNLHAPT
ncbi:putative reverse transcriptase, RNA-dependent DNA polymerase, LTR copia-type gag-polypeptide [Tanacetum coccineum]